MATNTAGITWNYWIQSPPWTTTTSSSTLSQNYIWNTWGNSTTGYILNNYQNPVWQTWQTQPFMDYQYTTRPAETPEQRIAREDREQAAREESARRRLAEQTRMAGAQDRAMVLLLSILTDEERLWHDQHDEIMVRGSGGGMFVIQKSGVHGNIKQVDEHGCLLGRVCVAPGMYDREAGVSLPLADGWVGQYLGIKHDEEALRAIGNWSQRGVCKKPDIPVLSRAA